MSDRTKRELCLHRDFVADVKVAILEDANAWVAEIAITCAVCGEPFRFVGAPSGFDVSRPMASINGRELRAPIAPMGARPALSPISTFTMPKVSKP